MTPAAAAYILAVLQALPYLIQAGASLATEISQLTAFMREGKDPTAEQWATHNAAMITALTTLLNAKPAGTSV